MEDKKSAVEEFEAYKAKIEAASNEEVKELAELSNISSHQKIPTIRAHLIEAKRKELGIKAEFSPPASVFWTDNLHIESAEDAIAKLRAGGRVFQASQEDLFTSTLKVEFLSDTEIHLESTSIGTADGDKVALVFKPDLSTQDGIYVSEVTLKATL